MVQIIAITGDQVVATKGANMKIHSFQFHIGPKNILLWSGFKIYALPDGRYDGSS